MNYGITKTDLKVFNLKLEKQREFLSSQIFQTKNGQLKSYLDISMSANFSSRYYAQLANKVNTLQQVMSNEGLTPVFLTITLDGVYHNLLKGDYSRFTLFHQKKLPENDIHGFLQTKASLREKFTVKDLYQIIRFQWISFLKSRHFKKIKKEGFRYGYLFSVEPHKSGVPHAHCLLYIPKKFVEPLKNQFKTNFWAKQNLKQSKVRLSPQQIKNGEINGFQWTLSNPVGYVMKYCTKSFLDIKNQEELDELQAWYVKHKIIRITMSHSLVPQWVYNKIYPLESDWLYLTSIKFDKFSHCEWSKEDDYFQFVDSNLKKVFKYDKGLYQLFIDDKLVREFGEKKEIFDTSFRVFDKPTLKSKNIKKSILVEFKGVKYLLKDDKLIKLPIIPAYMSNLELYQYYLTLNPDDESLSLHHYAIVKNECINRGLLHEELQSINDYNTDFPTYNKVNKISKIGV